MRSAHTHSENSSQGWALVSVLWVVTILAAMAISVQILTIRAAHMERRAEDQAQANALFETAIARVALGLQDTRISQRWRVDGEITPFTYNNSEMSVRVVDELGKIDLNVADGSMITRLLEAAGEAEDTATLISSRIQDWRSRSGVNNVLLTQSAVPSAIKDTYRVRHGPFRSVAELRLVQGVTPQLFDKIQPALTVYSGKIAFEPTNAPEMALRALYLNQPNKVADILRLRKENAAAGILGTRSGVLPENTGVAGRAFSIAVEISISGHTSHRKAVIEMTDDPNMPYFFLAYE